MWEQTRRQYKLPECSFVAVVQLLVAHLTLVLPQTISLTQLAQRLRVAGRCCSWHTAGIEEICHSCWCKQTLIDLNVRMDNVQLCAGYVPHLLGCCSPSQTCSLGQWGILWAYSSQLSGLYRCDSSFFLPGSWQWCLDLLSSPQQLHSKMRPYLCKNRTAFRLTCSPHHITGNCQTGGLREYVVWLFSQYPQLSIAFLAQIKQF